MEMDWTCSTLRRVNTDNAKNTRVKYPMEFHGVPWNSMELQGIPWKSMDFYGILCNSMEAPCISMWAPWNSIGFYRHSMEFYEVPCKPHGLPWSSMESSRNFHGSSIEYLWTLYESSKYWVLWNVTQLFNEHQKVNHQHKLLKVGQFIFMCRAIYWEDSFLKS